MGTVLIPLPDRDFDPTEAAVGWQVLTVEGHSVSLHHRKRHGRGRRRHHGYRPWA